MGVGIGKLLRGKEIGAGERCHWGWWDSEGDEGGEGWGRGEVIEKGAVLPGRQATKERKQRGGAVRALCC
jgi:hypothetical protein